MVLFLLNFRFQRNPDFSKNFDPKQKPTPYTCTTTTFANDPNNILLLLQAPEVRNGREAAVPEKETEILKEGGARREGLT